MLRGEIYATRNISIIRYIHNSGDCAKTFVNAVVGSSLGIRRSPLTNLRPLPRNLEDGVVNGGQQRNTENEKVKELVGKFTVSKSKVRVVGGVVGEECERKV